MIDKQVLRRFKQFQKKTGKYEDFKLENVQFDLMTLDKIAKVPIKGGGTPETSKREYWSDDFSLIDNENYYGWRNIDKDVFALGEIDQYSKVITKEAYASSSTWLVPENSILIAIASASKGLIVINQKPMCTNQNILGVVIREEFNLKYIFTNLKLLYADLEGKSEYGNLTKGSEEKRIIPIPKSQNADYPSLKIQEILVEFIEFYQHNTCEKLGIIEQITDKIATAESLLLPLFFAKHPSVSRRFDAFCKQQKIKLKLKDLVFENKKIYSGNAEELVCEKRMGFTPDRIGNGDINWFTVRDLTKNSSVYISYPNTKEKTTIELIKQKIPETSDKFMPIKKGDVLVSFKLTVGLVKIYDSDLPAYCNEAIDILTPFEGMDSQFLAYNCKLEYPKYGEKTNNGFTLNDEHKKSINIQTPKAISVYTSLQLQQIIVTFIESYFSKMSERKDLTASLKALFSTRNNMIIQKTFKTKDKK